MRILVLGDARQPHMLRWAHAWGACGATVECMSLEAPRAEWPGTLHVLRARGPAFSRYQSAVPQATELAVRFQPHAITSLFVPDYGWMGLHLLRALAGRGLARPRFLVAPLGSDLLINAGRTPFHAWRARQVLRAADLVAVDAGMLARSAVHRGAREHSVVRVDWLPDLARFAPHPERRGLPPLVVSTRQHARLYDLPTLLRGAGRARESGEEFRLVVAGEGPESATLKRQAASLGLEAVFPGRLDPAALADLLAQAAIYVSTARSDSTSVSLLEAMACGALPVVARIEGNAEWVQEGTNGLLFRPGDARDLARQLRRALGDTNFREGAAQANRRKLEGLPGFEAAVGRLAEQLK